MLITDASEEICREFAKEFEEESKNSSINFLGKKIDIGITGGTQVKVISEKDKRGILLRFEKPLDLSLLTLVGNAAMKVFENWVKNKHGIDVKVKVISLPRIK